MILSGKDVAENVYIDIRKETDLLESSGKHRPKLVVILNLFSIHQKFLNKKC